MELPHVSPDPAVQSAYERMRRSGESHMIAEMLALQSVPFIMTDSVFMSGSANGRQFEKAPHQGDHYAKVAAAAGVDVKGKKYISGLAEFPGDPRAWVDGRGDVERVVRERGWDCEGSVNVKAYEPKERKPIGVADDLIDSEVDSILETVPDAAAVDRQDLREQVKAKRKPHWAKD